MPARAIDIIDLMEEGYLPKELPPVFTSSILSKFIETNFSELLNNITQLSFTSMACTFNYLHSSMNRRLLSIPNPLSQAQVSYQICENWPEILSITNSSPYSLTKPTQDSEQKRAVSPAIGFHLHSTERSRVRLNAKYILKIDVAKFYQSIYTHSIPWVMHGKEHSKKNKNGSSFFGNKLDLALRNGQDKQTIGIPIGPDTSFVIAETILSKIDRELFEETKLQGIRFIDDYEISCPNLSAAESFLSRFDRILSDYELRVNYDKVKFIESPAEIESSWVSELIFCKLITNSSREQYHSLANYFNTAFKLAKLFPRESVLKFALGRLFRIPIFEENKLFAFNMILNCVINEPYTLNNAMRLFKSRFHESGSFPSIDYSENLRVALSFLIDKCCATNQSSEIAWALWCSIAFDIRIDSKIINSINFDNDAVVALLLLDYQDRGLSIEKIDFSKIKKFVNQEGLKGPLWLLSYEAAVKGWISPSSTGMFNLNDTFKLMKASNVYFYDNITKPLRLIGDLPDIEEEYRRDEEQDLGYPW